MFLKYWLILTAFLAIAVSYGQEAKLEGKVLGTEDQPVSGATIWVGDSAVTKTNENGAFLIHDVQRELSIRITAIGYATYSEKISLKKGTIHNLIIRLETDSKELQAIEILGLSKVDKINKLAYNVTAVDAKKLHNLSTDVGQVLNRVSGVKIREAGGMGSQANVSLNGYSGNQVKIFLDGLPIDNYGSSFQLNNIPINYIDQIEVYKGVVPVWLGGDALGGAINLVKSTRLSTYLDVSYSYGSFNTHRASVSTGYIAKSGFTVELNAYKNYSDNNYWVEADVVPDINSGVIIKDRVRRFHDMYKNQMLNLAIGFSNKRWADQLLVGINLGDNHADIQTGNRMPEVYGARFREGNIVQPTFLYKKSNLFIKGLELSLRGSFNFGEEKSVDTVYRRFNWYGESIPKGNNSWDPGGERTKELYIYRNNNANAALNLQYQINNSNALFFNNTFTSSNRKGDNLLQPDNEFYKQPKMTQKNIAGIGFSNSSIKNLDNNIFSKYYYQHVKAYSVYNAEYHSASSNRHHLGYGLASTYHLAARTQIKLSYERTYRVPELNELFGDVVNLEANPGLKPEHSDNFNLNLNHYFVVNDKNVISLNGGAIYRYAKDYIRYVLSSVNFDGVIRQVAQNQRDVSNLGFDMEIRYSFDKKLFLGGNVTYQNLRNQTKYETSTTDVSIFYKDRIPNIPYLFGTADVSYAWKNIFFKNSSLSVGYSLFYVHSYYLRWPSAGASGKETIPKQLSHDVNINYAIANGKYNIGIDGRNLTDALLYDNYMLQKPSRSFSIKFRYAIKN